MMTMNSQSFFETYFPDGLTSYTIEGYHLPFSANLYCVRAWIHMDPIVNKESKP